MTETTATAEEGGRLYPFVPKASGCLLENVSQIFVTGACVKHNGSQRDFLGGPEVKNPPAKAGDMGSVSGPGRSQLPQGN